MGCEASEKPKPKHRKGLWSPEEDERLRNYIIKYGHGCWSSVPLRAGLQRNGKSCRLRWINYLRPGLKRGMFNQEEEAVILSLHHKLGNKWSQIAQHLPGRTDNEIKNFWHSYLKKKVAKAEELDNHYQTLSTSSSDHTTSSSSSLQTPTFPLFQGSKNPEIAFENPTPFQNDFSKERSTFPKFFFAEWLPQDLLHFSEEAANGFEQNSEAANGFDQNLNSDQASHGGGFSNEAAALESELYEQISNPQTEILSPQFILEDQFQSGLLNLEFQLNNDLIYI